MKQYYQEMNQVLKALLAGEYDMIANLSNAAALLYQYLPDINWAGFYLWKNNELVLGPFQGKVACMHIPYGKGVCGTCIKELKTQRWCQCREWRVYIQGQQRALGEPSCRGCRFDRRLVSRPISGLGLL